MPLDPEDRALTVIEDEASVSVAREQVRRTCVQVGLPKIACESLVTATSELAHNQLVHARGGTIRSQPIERSGVAGVEVVATDRGFGIREPARALRGDSAAPHGMGAGLAGAQRLSDEMDFDVRYGEGTCIRARKFVAAMPFRSEVAILGRPLPNEDVSGDDAAFVRVGDDLILCVADGLGHGPLAREASSRAMEVFYAQASNIDLVPLLDSCHSALKGTRGVVMCAGRLDRTAGSLAHVCVGDIGGQVVRFRESRRLTSRPGMIGLDDRAYRPMLERVTIRPGEVIIAYSDGLKSGVDVSDDAALLREHPLAIADHVLSRYARDNDDAIVLVAR